MPLTAGALLLGCIGTPAPQEDSDEAASARSLEQARVAEILGTQGFDTTQLIFGQNDTVLVEGDMLMQVKDILDSAKSDIEKGYWQGKTVSAGDIYLNNSLDWPVSPGWVWAFAIGANNWNSHLTNIHFRTDRSAPLGAHQITVQQFDFVKAGLTGASSCSTANTPALPGNGSPASTISLNSGYNCSPGCSGETGGINGLPSDYMLKVATHELGHAIGLSHPGQDRVIPYTQSVTCCSENYASVMWQGCLSTQTVNTPSQDDALSVYVLGY